MIADPTYRSVKIGFTTYNPICYRTTDSTAMINLLKSLSFDNETSINKVDPDIYTIKNINGNTTKSYLRNACASLGTKTTDNSVTYVYILCHGDQYGTLYFGLDTHATVTMSELKSMLDGINGKIVLMLGSCHSGSAILEEGTSKLDEIARLFKNTFTGSSVAIHQGQGVFVNEPKYYVLTAAGADESGYNQVDYEYTDDGIPYVDEADSYNYFTKGICAAASYADDSSVSLNDVYNIAYRYCQAITDSMQSVQVSPSDSKQIIFQKAD